MSNGIRVAYECSIQLTKLRIEHMGGQTECGKQIKVKTTATRRARNP
jgi:hypothetical protein